MGLHAVVFHEVEHSPPTGPELLESLPWRLNNYNAPYLSGKDSEPRHEIVENPSEGELPADWDEEDTAVVIGDISHALSVEANVLVARGTDFPYAEKVARMLGYRPAHAGEFLQTLWLLVQSDWQHSGYFYCCAGRKPGYAILASYNSHRRQLGEVVFDTYLGTQVEDGYISANADCHCVFVKD